jgi:hypothetical protein
MTRALGLLTFLIVLILGLVAVTTSTTPATLAALHQHDEYQQPKSQINTVSLQKFLHFLSSDYSINHSLRQY